MTAGPGVEELRVVIADDHPVVRDGLSVLLGSVPGLVVAGTAATGPEAVRAAVTLRPDVLVMDIKMPGPAASSDPRGRPRRPRGGRAHAHDVRR